MSIATEICSIAERRLDPVALAQLVEIGVEVGDLSGVEPENLRFCLEALLSCPPFAGASAVINRSAGDALRLEYMELDDERGALLPVSPAAGSAPAG